MRKIFNKCLLFVFLLLNPLIIKAYGIENYYINAELQSNGDLVVQEYFELNGDYNGYERIIKYANNNGYEFDKDMDYYGSSLLYNGDAIILNEVRAVDKNSTFDFNNVSGKIFNKTTSASKGDYGVYTVEVDEDGETYLIYLPDSYNKAFYVKYTLKNMAVLHNDVGELWWEIFSNELRESVAHLEIRVKFPNNQNEFRVWAHGPLNGKVSKNGQNMLVATIDDLVAYENLDIRATFDKNILFSVKKRTYVDALDKILNYEIDAANQANYERQQEQKQLKNKIIDNYNSCLANPDKYCYNLLVLWLNNVTDDITFKNEYTSKLESVKEALDVNLEQEVRDAVQYAIDKGSRYWYNRAIEQIASLEDSELRKELEDSLLPLLEKIKAEERKSEFSNNVYSISMILVLIVIYIYVYYASKHKYDYLFKGDYLRDFPDESSPSAVSYLFHKKITNDAVSAEILNLINKKALLYGKNSEKKGDYYLEKNYEYTGNLAYREIKLLDFISNVGSRVIIKDLKKIVKRSPESFYKKWKVFSDSAIWEGTKFYDEQKFNMISLICALVFIGLWSILFGGTWSVFEIILLMIGLVFLYKSKFISGNEKLKNFIFVMSFVVFCISLGFLMSNFISSTSTQLSIWLNILTMLVSGIIVLLNTNLKFRNETGELAIRKWIAFKNFLEDFGNLDEKDLPEVHLWNKYLVYALVLGCADKLANVMELKLNEMNIQELNQVNYRDLYVINSAIGSSIRLAGSVATSIYNSNNSSISSDGGSFSSGSGSGGGFSSGSGGGGGGGGGRF